MDVLRSLVGGARFSINSPRSATFVEDIVSNLKKYGPALVRSFEIDDTMIDFRQPILASSDVIMARLHTVLQYTKDWKTLVAEWAILDEDEYEFIPLFDNYVPGKSRLHAMVLVGYRHNDIGGGYNFLFTSSQATAVSPDTKNFRSCVFRWMAENIWTYFGAAACLFQQPSRSPFLIRSRCNEI
jgi:hypothetical protein